MVRITSTALFGIALAGALAIATEGMAARRPRLPFVLAQATPPVPAPSASEATDSLRPVERMFLVDATETGRSAAEVARLAVSQASATGVRDFAQQMIADYGQINGSLEALARRKSVDLPLAPTSFTDAYRQLAGKAGHNFDRAYIRAASESSQRELRLCEAVLGNAKDTDIRELAGSLLPVLRDHVNKTGELEKSL